MLENAPMSQKLPAYAVISLCIVLCAKSLGAEPATPDAGSNRQALVVRLVDADGKPVEGASVNTFASFADFDTKSKSSELDESGWNYYPKVVSVSTLRPRRSSPPWASPPTAIPSNRQSGRGPPF